jgi:hypothetical protein
MLAEPAVLQHAFNAAQRHDYDTEGYLIARGVFMPVEIAALDAEAAALLKRQDLIHTDNLRCRWQKHVTTGECLFETFDPVVDIGPMCHQVAHDPRILDRLACLYDEEACLFKDKLIFKPPGAVGYDMHQDYIGWKSFPRSFITVLVAIDLADEANGCTKVYPSYHQRGYLSPMDENYHPLPAGVIDESRAVPLILEPGDVAFFGCFTPHCSCPNQSGHWRRQLYLSYNALSDGGQQRTQHYAEFHAWLRKRYAEYGRTNVYFQ